MSALWLTVDDADEYFETRLGASEYWASGTAKEAALTTAQADIENVADGVQKRYAFAEAASGAETDKAIKDAVCEQALFRLRDADIDDRAGVRAQGVVSAGLVQEQYDGAPAEIVICPKAAALLTPYLTDDRNAFTWST